MSITTSPVTSGSSLFGSLFGSTQGSATGLFGMLLSLFGQNAQTTQANALTNATSQPLSGLPANGTPQLTLQMLQNAGLIDQNGAILAAGTTGDETSLPSSAELLSVLQALAQTPTASPELKTLLNGVDDIESLQTKIAQLDDDQQQSLLGEIAALLMPPPAPQLAPLSDSAENTDGQNDLASVKETAPQPSLPLPADDLPERTATAQDEETAKTGQAALDALNRMLRAPRSAEHTASAEAATSAANLVAEAKLDTQSDTKRLHAETLAKTLHADTLAVAQADAQTNADQDAAASQLTRTIDQSALSAVAGAANSPPAPQAAPPAHQTSTASKAEAAQAISDVKVSPATPQQTGQQAGNMNAQGGNAQDGDASAQAALDQIQTSATDSTASAQSAKPISFADHVTKSSLSRTGANVPVSEQIAVQMSHALKDGQNQMTIKLHPADLGRIDVKIDVTSDGRVTASFSVEQPSTLDLLTKDQRGLERSLADAGLKTDSGTLSFNLRNDNGSSQQQSANTNPQNSNEGGQQSRLSPEMMDSDDTAPAGLIEMVWHISPDRVDVRI